MRGDQQIWNVEIVPGELLPGTERVTDVPPQMGAPRSVHALWCLRAGGCRST